MKRTLTIQLTVESGENSNLELEDAVCAYFESLGWKESRAHSYPNDITVVECPNVIPKLKD